MPTSFTSPSIFCDASKATGYFYRSPRSVALVRILTPKRDINILRDIARAKALKRPYVIAFCGVNGVGKSTNLAKICYWLTHNGQKVRTNPTALIV